MANDIRFSVLADVKDFESKFTSLNQTLTRTGKALTTFVTLPLAAAATGFVKLAGDAVETRNKFVQVMGDMTQEADRFTKALAEDIGRNRTDLEDGLAAFQSFAKGMGFSSEQAFDLSTRLQTLSLDFASFNNLSDGEALQRFISAMSGSGEVLDRFGINIKQSALDLKLQELGLAKNTIAATENEKALARLAIIEESLGAQGAIGDALRTQDSFANTLKRLQAEVKTLSQEIGEELIPIALKLVKGSIDLVREFRNLDTDTKKLILTFAGVAAALGPVLLGLSTVVKTVLFFNSGVVLLSANVVALTSVVTAIGGAIIIAFGVHALLKFTGALDVIEQKLQNVLFQLDVFNVRTNSLGLKEAEALNRLAVEKNRIVREQNGLADANRAEELSKEESHKDALISLEQEFQAQRVEIQKQEEALKASLNDEKDQSLLERQQAKLEQFIIDLEDRRTALEEHGQLTVEIEKKIADQILDVKKQQAKNEIQTLFEKLGIAEKLRAREVQNIDQTFAQIAAINKKFGRIAQTINIAFAIINTARGVTEELKKGLIGIPTAAVIAAQGAIQIASIAAQSFAVGTSSVPRDMLANVHQGEIIVPSTFSQAIRSGDLSLSGGGGSGGGGGITVDLTGSIFNGVTEEFVRDVFTKAGENIKNKTLTPLPAA